MKSAEFTEKAWLHTIKAAQGRDWDLPVDPRHDPKKALAALKQAHLKPMAHAEPDTQPIEKSVFHYAPTKVLVRGGKPFGFRLIHVGTGVPRQLLPVERELLNLEADFRNAHIRVWLEQLKLLGARRRQVRATDCASLRRSARGRDEAATTLLEYNKLILPPHNRAAFLAKKLGVTTACIRQRLKRGRR